MPLPRQFPGAAAGRLRSADCDVHGPCGERLDHQSARLGSPARGKGGGKEAHSMLQRVRLTVDEPENLASSEFLAPSADGPIFERKSSSMIGDHSPFRDPCYRQLLSHSHVYIYIYIHIIYIIYTYKYTNI